MKPYAGYALSFLLSFLTITAFSQNNQSKPEQFNNFPNTVNCSEAELSKIFNTTSGQTISLNFSNGFNIQGLVSSNISRQANLQTAILTMPDYANSIFSISKILNKDGSYFYEGRIINKNYFDGFELKRNETGSYQLQKNETDKVIPDCTQ